MIMWKKKKEKEIEKFIFEYFVDGSMLLVKFILLFLVCLWCVLCCVSWNLIWNICLI